jgi:hypothetical protein
MNTYYLEVNENDETGVTAVAFVDKPAIELNWQTFREIGVMQQFKTLNEERRIVSGVLMLANTPIYRRDKQNGEYNVIFTPDTIEKIVNKFFKQSNQASVNGMHNADFTIDGVYMFESFIIDKSRGIKAPEGFGDIPEGSWFGSFKVENQDIWDSYIKTGVFKGFSVEGMFNQSLTKADNAYSQMLNLLDELLLLAQNK